MPKKLVGVAIVLAVFVTIHVAIALVRTGWAMGLSGGYVARDFGTEFSVRLRDPKLRSGDFDHYLVACSGRKVTKARALGMLGPTRELVQAAHPGCELERGQCWAIEIGRRRPLCRRYREGGVTP